jgi:hypothetical protein
MRSLSHLAARFPKFARVLRHHRRIVAATVAGLGVLFALTSLQQSPVPPVPLSENRISDGLQSGEVAVPVTLTSPSSASALSVGDLIDLVGTTSEGAPEVLATSARVLRIPINTGVSNPSVLVVAVDQSIGTTLALSSTINSGVAVIIRSTSTRPSQGATP